MGKMPAKIVEYDVVTVTNTRTIRKQITIAESKPMTYRIISRFFIFYFRPEKL